MPAVTCATISNSLVHVLKGPAFATARILNSGAALYIFKRLQQSSGRMHFRALDDILHSDLGEFQWVGKKWPTQMQLLWKDIYVCQGCAAFQVSEVVLLSTHMLGVVKWGQEGAYSSEWVPGYDGRQPMLQPRWNNAWDANYERDLSDWKMERGRYQKEKFEWALNWWKWEEADVSAWKEVEPDMQQWDEEFVGAQKRVLDWSKADWTREETWEEWEKFLDEPGNTVFNPIDLTINKDKGLEEHMLAKSRDCKIQ